MTDSRWCPRVAGLVVAMFVAAPFSGAQQAAPNTAQRYVRADTMITMRDGVRLNTSIYMPRDQAGPLPMVFLRTPYGIAGRAGSLNTYDSDKPAGPTAGAETTEAGGHAYNLKRVVNIVGVPRLLDALA